MMPADACPRVDAAVRVISAAVEKEVRDCGCFAPETRGRASSDIHEILVICFLFVMSFERTRCTLQYSYSTVTE